MYVHFGHTKKCAQFFFKNCPKWPKFENWLKLVDARKSPFFDRKTSHIYDTHFGLKNGIKDLKPHFFQTYVKILQKYRKKHNFSLK